MSSTLIDELLKAQDYRNGEGSYNRLMDKNDDDMIEVKPNEGKKIANIQELLAKSLEANASDIHISAGAPPKYRIDGKLKPLTTYEVMTPEVTKRILQEVMSAEQIEEFEKTGDLDFAIGIKDVGRFRVNVYKQRNSYAGVFRLLSNTIPSAHDLRLPQSVIDMCNLKRGIVLVTGPTGSGKSTTLASLIDMINSKYEKNIITLEDPIEYLHQHKRSNVNQREMGVDSKSFSSALRSALREDPDVILVGEMRDFETISTAITAAETGHLVFSTLHTIGAAATIDRIIDTYPADQQDQARSQLSTVLEGVISQQLVPRKEGRGRVAAFEIMTGTTAIRSQIRDNKINMISGTIQTSSNEGMCLLDDNLYGLVKENIISNESALEFAVNKKVMEEKFKTGGINLNR